jgi:hypothetical protein
VVLGVLLVGAVQATSPTDTVSAIRAWLEGETDTALVVLDHMAPSPERDLDRGVVLLYRGECESAERIFAELRARDPRWLPAARWLARAQKELGRPEASDTTEALLRMPGATGRDHFWAARLYAERKDLQRARDGFRHAVASEDDLYLGWRALAELEGALGHPDAAQAARDKAEALYPGALPEALPPASPLPTGQALRYRAKYLLFNVATVVLKDEGEVEIRGRPARLLTLQAKSGGAAFFLHINSRYESYIGADGAVLAHRNLSDDSTGGRRQTTIDMAPDVRTCTVRQIVGGLFSYDLIPLPPRGQDGLSMIEMARAVARARGALCVIRVVNETWKGAPIRTVRVEPILWQGRKVDTVCVEITLTSRSAAGVAGIIQLWISADDRAIPYRAKMQLALGSITLELMPEEHEAR